MKRKIIYILIAIAICSCTKVIEYKGPQVEPELYVIGDLNDSLGMVNYIFVGETAYFAEGVDKECDKSAEVRVRQGDGEWELLKYNGVSGYGVSLEGMMAGDTMWMEVKSKEYETGKGFAVMPPQMSVEVVEFDTITDEDRKKSEEIVLMDSYAVIDITCENRGDWYFNMAIKGDFEYSHKEKNGKRIIVVRDTVKGIDINWWSEDQIFYGDVDVEGNVNIWELIFKSATESYTHLVMDEPKVRAKVYMSLKGLGIDSVEYRCLGLSFVNKVTSYDKYMYEETARSARNAGLNPFAEPTQLWNNVKAGEKSAGIFTITRVEMVRYNRHE